MGQDQGPDRPSLDVFVGRQREMVGLKAAMKDALSGRGRVVMLVGDPGIGKTRTCQELAEYAGQQGTKILWGRCHENPGTPPYWPWVQIIRAYLQERDAETVYQEMGAGSADISEIIPEVREILPGLPHSNALATLDDPEQARFRLFDAITGFFKAASRRQPTVLFLDNLHWADKSSLLLLEFLAQEISDSPMLVVGTYRDLELSRRHPLTETLAELTRESRSGSGFQRMVLKGLSSEEVGRFIEGATGITPSPDLVSALYAQTEGNPLFVTEVVRLLVQEGGLGGKGSKSPQPPFRKGGPEGISDTWTVRIPEGVREVIGRRLNRLSESCVQTLAIASVIGREFGLNELRALIDHMSEERLLQALEEAAATRVIEEMPQTVDRYQFSHVLIRETLYEELTASRRARLHRRIGEALEAVYGANLAPHLSRLAFHFAEAAQTGNSDRAPDKAIGYAIRAAERDMSLLAYEEAARYYEMAWHTLARQEPPADQARHGKLLLALGEAQKKAGESERAMDAFQQAAGIARKLGAPGELAQAAIGFEDASWRPGRFGGPAVLLLEEALGVLPQEDSILRVNVLAALVRGLYFSGLPDRASAVGRQAVEMARRIGETATLVHTLTITTLQHRRPETLEQRLVFAAEVLKLAEQTGNQEMIVDIYAWHLFDLLEAGDAQGVKGGLRAFQRHVEAVRQPFHLYVAMLYRASLAVAEGRFDEAERLARQALTMSQRLKGQDPSGVFGMKMFTIRKEQGRLPEVAAALKMFVQQHSASGAWRPGLALIYAELGMEAEARAEFETLAENEFAAIPQDSLQVVCLVYLAEVCAFLGDTRRAAVLYQLLLPWDGHNVVVGGGVAYSGAASRYLGILATVLTRWPEAERHFQQALEMDARMGAQTWLAHSQHEYARMLLARDRPGDGEKAKAVREQALNLARELGMRSLEAQIVGLQEQDRSTGKMAVPTYPAGLTRREVEVLRLIAQGRTNLEIAGELVISLNTVARHVSNIFTKTGNANRAEAATYALRQGLAK